MEDIDWIKKYGKDFKNQDDILSDMTEEEVKHLIKDYWKLIHDIIKEKN
jgi:ribosome recycling factor